MIEDLDLISIQEIRQLLRHAREAFEIISGFSQDQIDRIVRDMSEAALKHARQLAEMAVEETGIGVVADKYLKNAFAAENVYRDICDLKTVGIIRTWPEKKLMEVAHPVGVVCGIIPTTNPTSTTIFKALIAVKAGNPIIFSPHPRAKRCILATANILHQAAVAAGAPRGIISCPQHPTIEGTDALMRHPETAIILATGGSDMVRAAYSSGKPALGVGPGNVPAYIHRSANVTDAVKKIVLSKTFDNGTICASEQAIVTDRFVSHQVESELLKHNAYFLQDNEIEKLGKVLFTAGGALSADCVGRSADVIARAAKIQVPQGTRLLMVRLKEVGKEVPLSREKLSPVLAYYEVDNPDEACQLCLKLLELGGVGHSLVVHAGDEAVINEFALKKPVSRMLVNTPSSQGAIGLTTGLDASLTLGCGTFGGNATSDNITARHLINIKRVAWHLDCPAAKITTAPAGDSVNSDSIRRLVEQALDRYGMS